MQRKVLTTWSWILLLATALFCVGGALNILQRSTQPLPPTDGINWQVKDGSLYAIRIEPGSAGDRANIVPGDRLIWISHDGGKTADEAVTPSQVLINVAEAGLGGSLTYHVQRTSYSFKNNFYSAELINIGSHDRWNSSIMALTLIGAIFLAIGLFVLFKQGSSVPFVLHFFALCLTSFVFLVYRSLGSGQDLDLGIHLIDGAAFLLFGPLFLHFCWRYPTHSQIFYGPRVNTYALYVPAALLITASLFFSLYYNVLPDSASEAIANFSDEYNVFGNLYFINLVHFIACLGIGSQLLLWRFFTNKQTIVRQRLKWVVIGTIAAVIPVLGVNIAQHYVDLPNWIMAVFGIMPLALIPLTFGHSVIRYRLMDVDIVVRRALVYAVTTIAIAMMIGGVALGLLFFAIGDTTPSNFEIALRVLVATIAMAVIVMISEPIKNFLQERVDRYFYGERYDLRRGLMDFGRTLSATTAMEPLLNALVSRLQQVLNVEKVAVFIENEGDVEHYHVARSAGLSDGFTVPKDFRHMIRALAAQKSVIRADDLDLGEMENSGGNGFNPLELHYYVPCVVRGRMVAVIGLGRAIDGSLLSSEDIDILHTVSGFVAVAIENSLLYQEQQGRAEELALLKEFNESIIESVNVGLLAVDESGRVRSCNTTFEQLFGITRDDAVGRRVEKLFDEDFAQSLTRLIGKKSWHLTEIRNAYKLYAESRRGESLTLNVAIAPLRSPSGANNGAIIVLEDVSSRLKLEEQLQQREKLSSIGLLAAGVAHEVNTPLTGVSSYTQMLLGMMPESDPKHALLEKVHKQTERASNIVNNLLNFSRAGGSAEFTELNLNRIIEDTIQLLEVPLRRSNINLEKNYEDSLPFIHGNAGKLQQVFTNLILNARDAMPDGGTISLQTRMTTDGVEIAVGDTGEGIAPENLGKIYDPFFTTKEVGKGTGLGLAVSYGIIQEHSGEIRVESNIGEGTTFRLTFPAAEPVKKFKTANN